MSVALQEFNPGIGPLLESPTTGDVAALISKNTARSIAQFGKFERQTLVQLRKTYEEGWRRMQTTITLRGVSRRAGVPLSVDETVRLSMLKRQLEEEMRAMEGKLRELVPGGVGEAGRMGEMAGAGELDVLLKEIPRIGFPRFAIINREAVEFYANYALTTSIDYGQEALAAIKRRLDMALVTGEAYGPVVRDVRKLMLEKRGMGLTGLHHKANRVVRTEMVRAYQGGKSAYGQAADFVVGERVHNAMGACEECIGHSEEEYYYKDKGPPPLPYHPYGHCYSTYIFSKNLFTGEELARLEPEEIWHDAKSMDEAVKFAQTELLVPGGKADFRGIPLGNANLINRRLFGLISKSKVRPEFVGSTAGYVKTFSLSPKWQKIFIPDPDAYASYVGSQKAIVLTDKWWNKTGLVSLKKSVLSARKSGWFKHGTPGSLIDHEYAHLLMDTKLVRGYPGRMKIAETIFELERKGTLKKTLGGYGFADAFSERFAEMFAAYKAGLLPQALRSSFEAAMRGLI